MSLVCSTLSRFVITYLPRSKRLLISWLQSLSAVILEPMGMKSVTVSTFPSSIGCKVMRPDAMIFVFWMLTFKPAFSLPFSPSPRGSLFPPNWKNKTRGFLIPLHFVLSEWYHLHIWGYWYFSWQSWFQLGIHPAQHLAWCTLHRGYISRVTICSLDILLFQFWTNQLFHVWF